MNLFIFKWFKFSFGGLSTGQTKAYFNILAWTPEKVLQVFVLAILQRACAQEIIFYENKYLGYSHLLKNVLLNDNLALDYGVNE